MPAVWFLFIKVYIKILGDRIEMYKDSSISPDQLYPLIGQNIKRLRRKYNMTQEELAVLIDGDQKAISRIESGKSRPGLSTYLRIAKLFLTRA